MVLRIGHRGAAGTCPENTLVSFRRAVELGAHGIEFDVHRTRDGHLVVIHDALLNRTTNGTGPVMEADLAHIQALDAGSWKGAAFAGERVPTLRQVLRAVPGPIRLFLELKAGSIHYPGIEEQLLREVWQEGAFQRLQVSSFDHQALFRLHQLEPSLSLGMLYSENLLDPVSMAEFLGATALHPRWEWVTPELVGMAHRAGLQVNTWAVNLSEAIERVKRCGVDGIMSDFPERI